MVEEYDGINHEEAKKLIFVISMPMLMRGVAIQLHFGPELLFVRVPNIYNL